MATINGKVKGLRDIIIPDNVVGHLDDQMILGILDGNLATFELNIPKEQSERTRHYKATAKKIEEAIAYFKTFVIDSAIAL